MYCVHVTCTYDTHGTPHVTCARLSALVRLRLKYVHTHLYGMQHILILEKSRSHTVSADYEFRELLVALHRYARGIRQ